MKKILTSILAAAALFGASPVMAELDAPLRSAGWEEIIFDDKAANKFQALDAASPTLQGGVRIISDKTVSVAYFNVKADLNKTPKLRWEWQTASPIIDTDLTKKGGDDRNLSLYVAFPYQPKQAGFADKIKRKTIELLRGKDTPGRVLTYVWGGGGDKGTMAAHPYTGKYGALIFLRTPADGAGIWYQEIVDLRADFIKAFGFEPAAPTFIALTADTDDTGKMVTSSVRNITFTN